MTIKTFTGDKLSTQSLVPGKKLFSDCGNNVSSLIINVHRLIKKHQSTV